MPNKLWHGCAGISCIIRHHRGNQHELLSRKATAAEGKGLQKNLSPKFIPTWMFISSANNCYVYRASVKVCASFWRVQVPTAPVTGMNELDGIIQDYKRVLNNAAAWQWY